MSPDNPFDVTKQDPFTEVEEQEVADLANDILDMFEEELEEEIEGGNYRQALKIGQAWLLAAKAILRMQAQALKELFNVKPTDKGMN